MAFGQELKFKQRNFKPRDSRPTVGHCTPESMAAARRHSHEYFVSCYAMRARENACFDVLANQSGRAGYVDMYAKDSPNQPHHCGGAIFFAPDGEVLTQSQTELIRDELVKEQVKY